MQDTITASAARMSGGDLDAALALYEDDATLAPEPGTVLAGRTAIREALGGFVALRPAFSTDIQWVQQAGDLALAIHRWTLDGRRPDSAPIRMQGRAADVVRRGSDGAWRFVIAFPWVDA